MDLHEQTTLCTAAGERVPIKRVVAERLPGPFTALLDGRVVQARAVAWAQPGRLAPGEHWVHLTALCPGTRNGLVGVAMRRGGAVHVHGERAVPVEEVRRGTAVTTWFARRLAPGSPEAAVLAGTLLGGGALARRDVNAGTAALELAGDPAWCAARAHLLRCLGMAVHRGLSGGRADRPRPVWRSAWSVELGWWRRAWWPEGRRTRSVPAELAPDPLTLAVWWADVGAVDADGWGRLRMAHLRGDVPGQLRARALVVHGVPGVGADDVLWDDAGAAVLLRPGTAARLARLATTRLADVHTVDQLGQGVPTPAAVPVHGVDFSSARLRRAPRAYTVVLEDGARPFIGGPPGVAW